MLDFLYRLWGNIFQKGLQRFEMRKAEALLAKREAGTLAGLKRFLILMDIPRAKIYEMIEAHALLLVVPPGTWRDLTEVLQREWVPLQCRVIVFPTLSWWECRWSGIQIYSGMLRQVPEYDCMESPGKESVQ